MSRTAQLNALLKHREEWSTQAEAKRTSTKHKCTLQTQHISCRANNAMLSKPNRILQIITIFSAHHSILILLFNTPAFSWSSLHLHLPLSNFQLQGVNLSWQGLHCELEIFNFSNEISLFAVSPLGLQLVELISAECLVLDLNDILLSLGTVPQ